MKTVSSWFRVSFLALLSAFGASFASAGFKILPTFDSTITNDPNSAAIISCLNSIIALYESKFTDDITVKIYFREGGGLGSSEWGYVWNNAGVAYNGLANDATSPDDVNATNHMQSSGYGSIAYTTANGRSIGLATGGFISVGNVTDYDGIVTLNTSICFYDHNNPVGGKFDLYSAAAHEIDEVLGTPSGAGNWLAFTTDLYRFDNFGNRNFSGDTNSHVFFSIDGITDIVEYNQFGHNGGDWGDWAPHNPSMTQDFAIFSGIKIDPGEPEFRLLDVIGYDRSQVDPASFAIFRGKLVSGVLKSLYFADGDPLTVAPGITAFVGDFPVQVVLQGTSRFQNPASLKFSLTARTLVANIGQTIELYDYVTGGYVALDFHTATTSYSKTTVTVANPSRFVEPLTGHIQARIKYKGNLVLQVGIWNALLDQAVWEITP